MTDDLFQYMWVIYVLALPDKYLFIWNTTDYEICRQDILCMSDTFTFLSLPVRSEAFNCLVPINLTILKFATYLVSYVNFCQNF